MGALATNCRHLARRKYKQLPHFSHFGVVRWRGGELTRRSDRPICPIVNAIGPAPDPRGAPSETRAVSSVRSTQQLTAYTVPWSVLGFKAGNRDTQSGLEGLDNQNRANHLGLAPHGQHSWGGRAARRTRPASALHPLRDGHGTCQIYTGNP